MTPTHQRSQLISGLVTGAIGLFIMAVLMLCFSPSAHARSVHPHATKPKHVELIPVPEQQNDLFDFQLTPEQNAVVQWVIDSASPKLSIDQARKIVAYSYQKAQAISIDPLAFMTLMRLESRFNPHARSREGAQGLMQVLYKVHKNKFQGHSPYSIESSIDVGSQVFNDCLTKHQGYLPAGLNCYSGGGGKAYNDLYQHFHHQAQRYVITAIFNAPAETSVSTPIPQQVDPLPTDDSVYQLLAND